MVIVLWQLIDYCDVTSPYAYERLTISAHWTAAGRYVDGDVVVVRLQPANWVVVRRWREAGLPAMPGEHGRRWSQGGRGPSQSIAGEQNGTDRAVAIVGRRAEISTAAGHRQRSVAVHPGVEPARRAVQHVRRNSPVADEVRRSGVDVDVTRRRTVALQFADRGRGGAVDAGRRKRRRWQEGGRGRRRIVAAVRWMIHRWQVLGERPGRR